MHWLLRSRLGVVLVFGLLLLALDVGRSIWARVGLARGAYCIELRVRQTVSTVVADAPLRQLVRTKLTTSATC